MRTRALQQNVGRILILTLVVTASIMGIDATVAELAAVKDMHGTLRYTHIAQTILSAWTLTHSTADQGRSSQGPVGPPVVLSGGFTIFKLHAENLN
jgi:hypothetical protein